MGHYVVSYVYNGDGTFAGATSEGSLDVTYNTFGFATTYGSQVDVTVVADDAFHQHAVDNITNVVMTATSLALASTPNIPLRLPPTPSNGVFHQSPGGSHFDLVLPKSALNAGSYILGFSIAGDPIAHSIIFVVS